MAFLKNERWHDLRRDTMSHYIKFGSNQLTCLVLYTVKPADTQTQIHIIYSLL